MTYQFNAADLEQQMRVRGVFDPHWLLNPAKVFPLEAKARRVKCLPRDDAADRRPTRRSRARLAEATARTPLAIPGGGTKAAMGAPAMDVRPRSSTGLCRHHAL